MPKITVIFVDGDKFIDRVIEDITRGQYTHVAIQINGGVLESTGIVKPGDRYPGVHMRPITEYDEDPVAFIDVDLPDLAAAEAKARQLLGKFYSYIGCVEGGAYDLFGVKLHPWILKLVNGLVFRLFHIPVSIDTGEWTMNCSETVTRILRAGSLTICPDADADCVTPMDLYRYLTAITAVENKNIKEIDNMSGENTNTQGTTTAIVSAVVDTALDSLETEKEALIAKLKNEIISTKSTFVKFRNTVYIAALEEADDLILEALVNKLAKL